MLEKTKALSQDLNELRKAIPGKDKMKIGFDESGLHKGKMLIRAHDINYAYDQALVWATPLSFRISSGQRLAIKGDNGSGKTTLIKILLGQLQPASGVLQRADFRSVYLDQDYSLIDNRLSVYEQAQVFNTDHLQEHEIRSKLTHFLFTQNSWDKSCAALSGGEKMRLALCCLTIIPEAPDLILLDEPTNNLDIQNTELLTAAIKDYAGTLIVVSHDPYFLTEAGIDEELCIEESTH